MKDRTEYRVTAATIIIHVLILSVGFNILAVVFEFPEILRESADYRLTLFIENSSIIVPVYYFLALTGFTQIILSVMLHQSFNEGKNTLLLMATLFGVLTGIFQVMGFIRWPIVIPFIAKAMESDIPLETIAFVEGAFNRYAGMAIGEHLGFLCQATWTTLVGLLMLRHKLFDRRLGWVGIIIGILSYPMSMEPLGGFMNIFGELAWPVNAAWSIWLVFVAISLLRTNPDNQVGPQVGWKTALVSALVWLVTVVPTYF